MYAKVGPRPFAHAFEGLAELYDALSATDPRGSAVNSTGVSVAFEYEEGVLRRLRLVERKVTSDLPLRVVHLRVYFDR